MGIFNIAQYDTFIFYAHAIKDALAAGKDPRIGVSVVHQMWNRTFPGDLSSFVCFSFDLH